MAIRVAIKHRTEYHFDRTVKLFPHIVRLRPAPHSRTPISAYSLSVKPGDHFINWQQDPFGNYLARLVFPNPTRELVLDVEVIAEMTVINPFDFFLEESAEHYPLRYDRLLKQDLAPYLKLAERGGRLAEWVASIDRRRKRPMVDFLVELNQRLQREIAYEIRMAPGVQSCDETLKLALGSCRDSAWLLVQILRHLGLAARFVSGYLVQLKADIESLDGPSGPAQDFTDLHAWTEVYLPGAGWVGLDPTSGLFAGEGHIPLACTPDPSTAAAIAGSTGICESRLEFVNQVERIYEDPRVTRPYGEPQWKAIDTLGRQVDTELKRSKVVLTLGGEPTFVSIDDMEGPEWNYTALGDAKRRLAGELLQRLRRRFAPAGMLHYGQGKWYPGEPLPRWALTLFWRQDGRAVWQDDRWLGDELTDHGHGTAEAEKMMAGIVSELKLPATRIVAAHENTAYYLWREGTLPRNLTPENNKLKDPLERKRLARVFRQGIGEVVGFALPLKFVALGKENYWQTGPWPFRGGKLLLIPGDSPLGFRIPLDSLPWKKPAETEPERDPFEDLAPLGAKPGKRVSEARDLASEIIHTALCVEARHGRLYVFMPPLKRMEYYFELLAAIERAAAKLKLPIVLEGYEPPADPRVPVLKITPDPGVIEVNIHPSRDWKELVEKTEVLYEEARQTRLGTEKFMLDGRHSGTGGGNHVTLGGPTADQSPFLRRPHLLRSLITFWQHHPALSYLFSGLFIGPTSQAPRVDEARDDNLYELEIAFDLLPKGDSKKPWLVDRVLRNFLVDLTGNTHRAEFSIDKLYSPDSASGRLGLVEFRGFEMPPHPRMSLVQMLLIRALVARFWRNPYQQRLIRWGTELHDRFMLGHFVWEDMREVVEFLRGAGYEFELEWFEPFREFRFPRIGSINLAGMQLELHSALEPWHVLGEETSAQGTSRYVDSSVERLQVSVHGMTDDRFLVTCNGRRVPLHASGVRGHYVGGVRYKAWDPHSALHPTIGTHTPLVFDIVDIPNRRSIGGCTYHVSHPGGRSYDTFPVNANEAEARRQTRFLAHGHSQGTREIPPEETRPEQPYSLDLRFAPPAVKRG